MDTSGGGVYREGVEASVGVGVPAPRMWREVRCLELGMGVV